MSKTTKRAAAKVSAQNKNTPPKANAISEAIESRSKPESELEKQCDKFGLRPVIHDAQCRACEFDWKALAIDGRSQPWEMRGYCDPERISQSEALRLYASLVLEYEPDDDDSALVEWLRRLASAAEQIEASAPVAAAAHNGVNKDKPLLGIDESQLERVAGHMAVSSEEFIAECVRVTLNECDPEHTDYRAEIYASVREQVLEHRIGLRGEVLGGAKGGAQ